VKNVTVRTYAEPDPPITNLAGSRRSAIVLAVITAMALASGCAAKETAAAPVSATSAAAPSATTPAAESSKSSASSIDTPAPEPAAGLNPFGTEFQTGPDHDWSKGQPIPFEGVLRGWLTSVDDSGVAEYKPIRFAQSGGEDGHFEGPEEGDVIRYAAPLEEHVEFLAADGCDGATQTYDEATNLGTEYCARHTLIDHVKEAAKLADVEGAFRPALITTKDGQIVKVVEIFWQGGG
jgi:hypothetical protein